MSKIDELKVELTKRGISFHPRTGEVKLQLKLDEAIEEEKRNSPAGMQSDPPPVTEESLTAAANIISAKPTPPSEPVQPSMLPLTEATLAQLNAEQKIPAEVDAYLTEKADAILPASAQEILRQRRKEAAKLIRVIVRCNNPNKSAMQGDWFSVGSAQIGTFKRYVPFDLEEGWHIEQIIYKEIANKTCNIFRPKKVQDGRRMGETSEVVVIKEFNVTVLPPLTDEERKELAESQKNRGAIEQGHRVG